MGSKSAHADEIVAIASVGRNGGTWVEPFVGGGNVIVKVTGDRIGNDLNWKMVALLDGLGNRGWLPPEEPITEDKFDAIKADPDSYAPELVAFVATSMTFGSKWFDVFARDKAGVRDNNKRYDEGYNSCLRDAPGLRGVKFFSLRYKDLTPHIPPGSTIYCDPPYAGTAGYGGAKTDIDVGQSLSLNIWDRTKFWRWADMLVEAGHRVFVSEYKGPPPTIYRVPPDGNAAARLHALQADPQSASADITSAVAVIKAAEKMAAAECERLAARWQTVWEKEVTSSFDSGRGAEGKREVEKLFHRC